MSPRRAHTTSTAAKKQAPAAPAAPAVPALYEAPTVAVLGSLAELTLGGSDGGISDGWGGAGDSSNSGSWATS